MPYCGQRVPGRGSWAARTSCGGFLHVLVHPAALQRGHTGAALLQDLVVRQDLEERVHLFRAAGQLQHHAVGRKINDLCLVDAGDLPQLTAVVDIGSHLEQQQLPLQRVLVVQHEHLPGHFQPLGLEDELAQRLFIAGDGHGDAADRRVVGGGHRQAVDVEAAAAEQVGHPGQNTALVVHQQTDDSAFGFHGSVLLIP